MSWFTNILIGFNIINQLFLWENQLFLWPLNQPAMFVESNMAEEHPPRRRPWWPEEIRTTPQSLWRWWWRRWSGEGLVGRSVTSRWVMVKSYGETMGNIWVIHSINGIYIYNTYYIYISTNIVDISTNIEQYMVILVDIWLVIYGRYRTIYGWYWVFFVNHGDFAKPWFMTIRGYSSQ